MNEYTLDPSAHGCGRNTDTRKQRPASPAAFLQAILDSEGLTLTEQLDALQAAYAAVSRKLQTETHARPVIWDAMSEHHAVEGMGAGV